MGYAQELLRRMSGFSNFAISFSIICILAGGITSLQLGVSAVGGAAAGIVWPLGVGFSLIVEGLMNGMHRSPYQGISVEFAQHRPYVAGDDIRHVEHQQHESNSHHEDWRRGHAAGRRMAFR